MVASPRPVQDRHPAAVEDVHLAGLRARLELELGVSVERRDRDPRAERRLGHRQVDLREDVVALAREARVVLHVDEDVDVARLAARQPGVALAGDADPLAVVDARRDVDVEPPLVEDPPAAAAGLARRLDHATGAVAAWARLRCG